MANRFTLEYWMDDDLYIGRLKEVPGDFSQGDSLQELETNIRDAYDQVLEGEGEALPSVKVQTKDIVVEI